MTKTAEQISISNMDMRLDVETTKYELKDLAITLNEMIDRLDKDYDKQKRFVSDVSHELRTPISIISGYASMLERWGKKDEEILDESIEAIIGESKNMQHLVENLLTLVRSDNQTLKYEPITFDIGKLICDVVKEFNMVNNKDQYITCDSSENIMVHLDELKIKQALRIFTDNAVKYTPINGGIQVKCYKMNKEVYIHIKDTGIGISKQDLPFLFERFYRSDESRTKQTGGHGLGLSIARVIIIGHKGKIKVKSRIGKGSEFIITLPMRIEGDYNEISTT
jgi:signal transduction histidine kinase